MTAEDAEQIAELDKECFAIPWSYNSFVSEMQNDIARYLVAKDNEKCIGYCGFWNTCGEGDITNVAVSPSYRRQGIGTMLIEAMISLARSENITSMNLEVRATNVGAQALYSNFGFEVAGTRKGYYSDNHEDALVMED